MVQIVVFAALILFSAACLFALVSVVYPFKALGFNSRTEAIRALFGSVVILLILAFVKVTFLSSEPHSSEDQTALPSPQQKVAQIGPSPQQVNEGTWREAAASTIRKEPTVVEAMFPNNSRSSFWLSVRNDGSRWDGFAEYVCTVFFGAGMPVGGFVVIHVWDAAAMKREEMRELGRFDCARKG